MPEIDFVRAISIVAVVAIHSFLFFGEKARPASLDVLAVGTRFAVPAFFFVAGFLAARGPVASPALYIRSRLQRLLVPYVIASAITLLSGFSDGGARSIGDVVFALLFASAWGPYYFVFVLVALVLVTPFMLRLPFRLLVVFCILLLVCTYWFEHYPLFGVRSLFWAFRNPLRWGSFYVAGIVARPWLERTQIWAVPRVLMCALLLSMSAIALLGLTVQLPTLSASRAVAQLSLIWATIVALLAWGRLLPPVVPISWLSEASYSIYLYHLFFVRGLLPPTPPWPSVTVRTFAFGGALMLSVAFVWLIRRALGPKARLLFG
ncbi:MAG: acyltransferase [Candidatus Binatia bacterium]|nr:acyltransferase [Candidatus Binatia bacterium]